MLLDNLSNFYGTELDYMLKLYQNIEIEFYYFSILNSLIPSQNLQLSVKVVIKLLSISVVLFVC